MEYRTQTVHEFFEIAHQFCEDNAQTSFLLKRLKAHDKFIYEHSLRAAYYSLLLAQGLGLSGKDQEMVYRSALLEDIGKLRISAGNGKECRLGEDGEVPGMRKDCSSVLQHPEYSASILRPMIERGLVDRDAVLQHHENLDGTGYPHGLLWEDITLNARILRIADGFATMTSVDRGSATLAGIGPALTELYRWADILYDGDLVMMLCHYYEAEVRRKDRADKRIVRLIRDGNG